VSSSLSSVRDSLQDIEQVTSVCFDSNLSLVVGGGNAKPVHVYKSVVILSSEVLWHYLTWLSWYCSQAWCGCC